MTMSVGAPGRWRREAGPHRLILIGRALRPAFSSAPCCGHGPWACESGL